MPRPLRVFLCHASQDKPAVRELYSALKNEGWIDPWLDKAKILPGQDWEMVIEKAVDDSDVVIACLSSQSVTKEGFVQREIRYAYDMALEKPDETIFLIPLRLDDCIVPRKLRTLHWVDYFGPDKQNSYSDLLEALKLRYEQKSDLEMEEIVHKQVGKMLKSPTEVFAVEKVDYESKPAPHVEKKKSVRDDESVKRELPVFAMGLFTFIIISIFVWGIYTWNKQKASPVLLPTETLAATELPADTEAPAVTELPSFGIGSTMISEKDGMVLLYVPEGEFTMGSEVSSDEQPIHQVDLDAFWIDQTEVTNAMYAKCVADSRCFQPSNPSDYFNSNYANHPVVYVDWNMANTYCSWAGRELPTEAQWEKAARGTDGRIYPWGNEAPNSDLLNSDRNISDTTMVKNYPNTKSFYGTYDMAGNVWEWVNDWYDAYPGGDVSTSIAFGQKARVLRGGSWDYDNLYVRSQSRFAYVPMFSYYNIGFRCSRSQ